MRLFVLGAEFQVGDVDARLRVRRIVTDFVLDPTTQPWGDRSMLAIRRATSFFARPRRDR